MSTRDLPPRRKRRLLPIEEAVLRVGLNAGILKRAVKAGSLPAVRPSGFERGRLYFHPDDLDAWMESIKADA